MPSADKRHQQAVAEDAFLDRWLTLANHYQVDSLGSAQCRRVLEEFRDAGYPTTDLDTFILGRANLPSPNCSEGDVP